MNKLVIAKDAVVISFSVPLCTSMSHSAPLWDKEGQRCKAEQKGREGLRGGESSREDR